MPDQTKTTIDRLKTIIADQLGLDKNDIHADSKFRDDLGTDSLDEVELVMAAEEEFDTEISDEAAEKIETVEDAVKLIDNLIGK
jgi:acyl carrier protein